MPLVSFTETEITLKARRRLERPLLVTIWIGISMLSLSEGNWFYFLAGTFTVALNMLAVHRRREVYVKRLFVNIGVCMSTVIFCIELFASPILLPARAVGHYMILIQVCKLFERKSNRDYVQMLTLSVLTVVVASMFSQAIWFALLLIVFIAMVCYCAMIFTIKRGLDGSAHALLATEAAPLSAQQVAWNVIRDWPTSVLLRSMGWLVVVMLASGVAVFFLAPRSSAALSFGFLGQQNEALSGQEAAVKLGEVKEVYLSNRIVMRVTVKAGSGRGFIGPVYLRGRTFEFYKNSGWENQIYARRGDGGGGFRGEGYGRPGRGGLMSRSFPLTADLLVGATVQEITMDPNLLPQIFGLYPMVYAVSPDGQAFINSSLEGIISASDRGGRMIRYTVYSLRGELSEEQDMFLQARQRFNRTIQRPEETVDRLARVKELAGRWCSGLLADSPDVTTDKRNLSIARRIEQSLKENYSYTLDLSSADSGRDGVEDFLFHMRKGHCEYFASAMTMMCRLLGVRARLVTGFKTDEYDKAAGCYIVRDRDAHAWTEVYTPGQGWVSFDPTSSHVAIETRSWYASLGLLWDQVQFYWYNLVVGYGSAARGELGKAIAAKVNLAWNGIFGVFQSIRSGMFNLLVKGYMDVAMFRLMIAIAAGGILVELMLMIRWQKRKGRRKKEQSLLASQPWGELTFVNDLLDRLRRQGLEEGGAWTSCEIARAAAANLKLPEQTLSDLVALYYRARWGHLRPSPDTVSAARTEASELKKALSKKTS